MIRSTVVVQGSLAYAARRAAAARGAQSGLQIMTMAQLAGRLAGGFLHQARDEELERAVRAALDAGGFQEIEDIRHLPGMTRAITRTLRKAWHADLLLAGIAAAGSARVSDLALIETRVKDVLPSSALLPADLRDAALARAGLAPTLLGDVCIDGVHFIEPVWRPLLQRLGTVVSVVWRAPPITDTRWFQGIVTRASAVAALPNLVTCADPRHEVVEALRWARSLLASGQATAGEIAICGVATEEWDDHVLALVAESRLRISFSHGIPCLSTADGQRCAALADALLHGLSQDRVRRLLALAAGHGTVLDVLPQGWLQVSRGASLNSVEEWTRALEGLPLAEIDPKPIVLPLLSLLEKGADGADGAADAFLRGRSRRLWERATRAAPAAALELTLKTIRIEEDHDPADSIVWCPAWQLAAAPRPWVRLLGLTSRGWPRWFGEDPLLPDHIVRAAELDPDPPAIADRRVFGIISALVTGGIAASRSRRNAQGGLTGPSPLLPPGINSRALARTRLPEHALSEGDRLAARPQEALESPLVSAAVRCWQDWHTDLLTAHDGMVKTGHPVIASTIAVVQSPTSLTRMLRDPLGFTWRYALGWRAHEDRERPLTLSPQEFGRLVHELLRRTVDSLEPTPGFIVAHPHEIADALDAAARFVTASWPLERPVPPHVLWVNTVRQATELSLAGLSFEKFTEAGTRSWTEVPFGEAEGQAATGGDGPWDPSLPVRIPGTPVSIRGKIDRVDLRAAGVAVRVTDYKTGQKPDDAETRILAGGAELQRILYALACRQLLPDTRTIVARLIYLKDQPTQHPLSNLEDIFAQVSQFVVAACTALESGSALPGVAADQRTNDLRLALPASPGYFRRKQKAFQEAARDLARFWDAP